MNDTIGIFISFVVLILGFSVFYIMWDNSCKKWLETAKARWECWRRLHGWMDKTEDLLDEMVDDPKEVALFEEVRRARCEFDKSQEHLKKHLKEK